MYFIFDIGGTHTRAAVSRDLKEFAGEVVVEKTPSSFTDGIALIVKLAFRLVGAEKLTGVVGGIAGSIKSTTGELAVSPHLPDWSGKNIKQELSQKLGTEVLLANDAELAGLGEATRGAGKGFGVVAYLTISTGVGGARIVRGKLDRGLFNFEPGHARIDLTHSLEELISGSSLEKKYGRKPADIKDKTAWEDVEQFLALGIHNMIVHWSPSIVVLGGPVAKRIDFESLKMRVGGMLSIYTEAPDIVQAALGDSAGLYGALELLRN